VCDNSPNNKSNPDATQGSLVGRSDWEEMMFTGLLFSVDPGAASPGPAAGGQH
jgi:hypothetical protein